MTDPSHTACDTALRGGWSRPGHCETLSGVPLQPGDVFAGYSVVRKLGEGGMGAVHLVRHPRLPRLEALKVLRPEYSSDADFARRFLREAELVAGLEHRNIVPVLDRGEDEGRLWLTMRFVDGIDVEHALRAAGGLLPARRAVRIVGEVAAALDCAHRSNLVHRDVKPANVLLSQPVDDEPEQVFLTDFGIARSLDAGTRLTRTGMVLATFDYASPEQIESRELDGRSDVYALGCVLHRLLTGSVPFPGDSVAVALHGHLALPPPRPTARAPWLPPALDDVVARAMAKDPADRYPTCRALAADALAALDSQPTLPPVPFRVAVADAGGATRLSSEALRPADRERLTGLLRQTRFFDLPPSLLDAGAPAVPGGHAPTRRVTLEVSGGGRTHRVVADLALARRPPELDDLVATVRELGSAAADPPVRTAPAPTRPPAPSTVLELPRQSAPPAPVYRPPAVPPPSGRPAAVPPAAVPPVPVPPAEPTRTAGRRRFVALALVAALAGAGGTTYLLTRSDDEGRDTDAAADDGPAAALAALPASPTPLPGTAVVLSREIDGATDLFAADGGSGAVVARLAAGPDAEVSPVVLPGRRTVVYLRDGDAGREWRVVAADGSGDRALFPGGLPGCADPGRPTFDPAEPSRLALTCGADGGISLRLATLDGVLGDVLHEGTATAGDPAFSPDGTRVVFFAGDDPRRDGGALFVVDVDSPDTVTRITGGEDGADADPAWSPDGDRLAWRRAITDTERGIVVGSPTTADDARFLTSGDFDQDPVWAPDGGTIAYKSSRTGDAAPAGDQVWLMDADGSDPRQLPAGEGAVVDGLAWADHG